MSRKNMTRVANSKLVACAQRAGLEIEVNKGWTKCYAPGQRKRALGIPNTKSCTIVEIVGFTHEIGVAHPKPPAKTVEQCMDFSGTELSILKDFLTVARDLFASSQPKVEEKPAEQPASEPASPDASSPAEEQPVAAAS